MSKHELSSLRVSTRKFFSLLVAGGLLACFLAVVSDVPERASAMEIDCSSIGGSSGLPAYVEDYGVHCSGGSGGGGGTGSGGGTAGCTPSTDKLPEGFFEIFNKGVDDIFIKESLDTTDGTGKTQIKIYRTDVSGKRYVGGVISVWSTPRGSGIVFYNFLSGGYQVAFYNKGTSCATGYGYDNIIDPATGKSPATPTLLVAPGLTASSDGSVLARGALTQLPATTNKYLLRVDVTNNNATTPTPVGVSLVMNDFDVESVVAGTGGVDCKAAVDAIQDCSISEMAPKTTQSMTLLLTAHTGAPANADIPIMLSYQNARTPGALWFYSASRPGPVVIDPVPTPPSCTTTEPGVESVVAGLLSSLTTTCLNGLPMNVVADHGRASIDSHGTLNYTPDPAYHGSDTLFVTASNAHGRVSAPTAVEVTVVDPPHAEADSFTARAGTTLVSTVSVLENDSINGGEALPMPIGWSAQQSATSSEHGRVILNPDGTFTYTPEHGFSGLDTFEYQLEGRNSAVSNRVTVTLQVVVP